MINQVVGRIYCSIQYAATPILAALLTLYVAIFGVQILMGTAQLSAGEILMRMFKIVMVWTFATQAAWGIGMAFEFFLSLMGDGIAWVTNALWPMGATDGNSMPVYAMLDGLVYNAVVSPLYAANAGLIGFFAVMSYVFFPIFALASYWLMMTLMTLARTLVSFLMSISAIAFLIALSPIFLCFMLFQASYHIFENWLRYMVSYALQIIIVFAVMAMWLGLTSQFIGFFGQLSQMIKPYQVPLVEGVVVNPADTWGICTPQIATDQFGSFYAQCAPNFEVIPPSRLTKQGGAQFGGGIDFLYFVVYHLLALTLIGYAFSIMMDKAPNIAQDLVGPAQAPALEGAGFGEGAFASMTQRVSNVYAQRPGFGVGSSAASNFRAQNVPMVQQRPSKK
jgi:type IV secretory pathway VirB6-like protein